MVSLGKGGTWIGIVVGASVPPELSLDFSVALAFIALTVPHLKSRPTLAAATASIGTFVLSQGLPHGLALVPAAISWDRSRHNHGGSFVMSWTTIFVIGGATFLFRASFLLIFSGQMPERIKRALHYVPVAVLPALIASAVIGKDGTELDIRIVAAVVGALIAWRTRSVAAAMVLGMAALWGLQYLT